MDHRTKGSISDLGAPLGGMAVGFFGDFGPVISDDSSRMGSPMLIAALLVLLSLGVFAVFRYIGLFKALEKQVDQEVGAIEGLSLDDAYARCEMMLLSTRSVQEEWPQPVPAEMEALLGGLEPRLAAVLRRWRKLSFAESGLVVGLEAVTSKGAPGGMVKIGTSTENRHELYVSGASPVVHEFSGGKVVETYPSLFHLILAAEEE